MDWDWQFLKRSQRTFNGGIKTSESELGLYSEGTGVGGSTVSLVLFPFLEFVGPPGVNLWRSEGGL